MKMIRIERKMSTDYVGWLCREVLGRINDDIFAIGNMAFAPGTLLFLNVKMEINGVIKLLFAIRPEGWGDKYMPCDFQAAFEGVKYRLDDEDVAMFERWYFTFSPTSKHAGHFTFMDASNPVDAREWMNVRFPNEWDRQYASPEEAGVYEKSLTLL